MLLLLESGIVLAENDLDQQNYEIFSRFGSSNCFFGTASPTGEVTVNGKSIERSDVGHFAPSFPLEMGEEEFEWITNQVAQQRLASAIAQGIEEWFASVN